MKHFSKNENKKPFLFCRKGIMTAQKTVVRTSSIQELILPYNRLNRNSKVIFRAFLIIWQKNVVPDVN